MSTLDNTQNTQSKAIFAHPRTKQTSPANRDNARSMLINNGEFLNSKDTTREGDLDLLNLSQSNKVTNEYMRDYQTYGTHSSENLSPQRNIPAHYSSMTNPKTRFRIQNKIVTRRMETKISTLTETQ